MVSARCPTTASSRASRCPAGASCVAVQWHPESFWNRPDSFQSLFDAHAEACRARLAGTGSHAGRVWPMTSPRSRCSSPAGPASAPAPPPAGDQVGEELRRGAQEGAQGRQADHRGLLGRLVRLVPPARPDDLRGPVGRAQGPGLRRREGRHRGLAQGARRRRQVPGDLAAHDRLPLARGPAAGPGERLPGARASSRARSRRRCRSRAGSWAGRTRSRATPTTPAPSSPSARTSTSRSTSTTRASC